MDQIKAASIRIMGRIRSDHRLVIIAFLAAILTIGLVREGFFFADRNSDVVGPACWSLVTVILLCAAARRIPAVRRFLSR